VIGGLDGQAELAFSHVAGFGGWERLRGGKEGSGVLSQSGPRRPEAGPDLTPSLGTSSREMAPSGYGLNAQGGIQRAGPWGGTALQSQSDAFSPRAAGGRGGCTSAAAGGLHAQGALRVRAEGVSS
jgi:hypothetical protein